MSELTKEQFEQVPDFLKSDYTEVDGVYKHGATVKLKQSLNELDAKYKTEIGEVKGQLTQFQEQESKKIEEARTKALEEARTNGDVKAIEERYQQQMQDLEKRTEERVRGEVTSEFQQQSNDKEAKSIATKVGLSIGIDSDAGEAITDLIQSRVKYENGRAIFHDAKGSALSVDQQGFISELTKEARFKRLIKAELTTAGGGEASGAGKPNGSTGGKVNEAAETAKKNKDLGGFLKASLKVN